MYRRYHHWLIGLLAFILMLGVAPPVWADEPASAANATFFEVTPPDPALPHQYARITRNLPIYRTLDDALAGRVNWWLTGFDTWVSIQQGAKVGDNTYYQTSYGWVPGHLLAFAPTTTLKGVDLRAMPNQRMGMIYWPHAEVRAAPAANAEVVAGLEGYNLITIQGEQWEGRTLWYAIGPNQWIDRKYIRHLTPGKRPADIPPTDKWIEVNLSEQMIFAHEGDTPVYGTMTATGLRPRWPTVQGTFRIWVKFRQDRMQGGLNSADYYDLADVPWTMYFHRGYGLHTAYWHDKFGAERSHGCVNLSPTDAKWLFDWAGPTLPEGANSVFSSRDNPGTWVWVHY